MDSVVEQACANAAALNFVPRAPPEYGWPCILPSTEEITHSNHILGIVWFSFPNVAHERFGISFILYGLRREPPNVDFIKDVNIYSP